MSSKKIFSNQCFLIEGIRTPFIRSKTNFNISINNFQLLLSCLRAIPNIAKINKQNIDHVVVGNAIINPLMTDIARNASIIAGYPHTSTAHTISMSCLSSLMAIQNCKDMINNGNRHATIALGVETMSQIPVLYHKDIQRQIRDHLLSQPSNSLIQILRNLYTFSTKKIFNGQTPILKDFLSKMSLGESCETLISLFNISRLAQDQFALKSHENAKKASQEGLFDDMIIKMDIDGIPYIKDDGIRDTNLELLSNLQPCFSPLGTLTAGNSSFPTDGAAACLLTSESFWKKNNLKPQSIIKDSVFIGCDPYNEMLLGPVFAIYEILKKTNLKLEEIDVFEFHEAFAGQVLCLIEALASPEFCKQHFGSSTPIGRIDSNKLNSWGGSLAIGHPLGATGIRILNTASRRLSHSKTRYALVSACASGGQACALILERFVQ